MATTPADRARWALRDLLDRWVGAHHPEALCAGDGDPLGRPRFDPLPHMRALMVAANTARQLAREAAKEARAHGRTWDQVAGDLGLDVEEAYQFVGGGHDVGWRCSTCGGFVMDQDVYLGGEEAEQGHEPGCSRWLAQLDAQRRYYRAQGE